MLWASLPGLCAGFAIAFVSVGPTFFALVNPLDRRGGKAFIQMNREHVLVKANLLLGAFPYIRGNEYIYAICSDDIL